MRKERKETSLSILGINFVNFGKLGIAVCCWLYGQEREGPNADPKEYI